MSSWTWLEWGKQKTKRGCKDESYIIQEDLGNWPCYRGVADEQTLVQKETGD